jgi:hypothetical protein
VWHLHMKGKCACACVLVCVHVCACAHVRGEGGGFSSEHTAHLLTRPSRVAWLMFHSLMLRSSVPPPVARVELCHGHHAIALTAAECEVYLCTLRPAASHTLTTLSLPPLARYLPSGDHRNPHTSWVWPPRSTCERV